jgi:hypothetical protein
MLPNRIVCHGKSWERRIPGIDERPFFSRQSAGLLICARPMSGHPNLTSYDLFRIFMPAGPQLQGSLASSPNLPQAPRITQNISNPEDMKSKAERPGDIAKVG